MLRRYYALHKGITKVERAPGMRHLRFGFNCLYTHWCYSDRLLRNAMQCKRGKNITYSGPRNTLSFRTQSVPCSNMGNKAGLVDTRVDIYNSSKGSITTDCVRSNRLMLWYAVCVICPCRSSFQNFVYVKASAFAGLRRLGPRFWIGGRCAASHACVLTRVLRLRRY